MPVREESGCSRPSVSEPHGAEHHRSVEPTTGPLIINLAWGLGDVLLSTSAIRQFKALHPDVPIIYRTYRHNRTDRYRLSYDKGTPAQMLEGNPDIDQVIDWFDPIPTPSVSYEMRYAWFGGPSLDYPIQAHYWENLGLEWEPGQRFDAYYYLTDREREWARGRFSPLSLLALTPHGGWAGKMWTDAGWAEVIAFALKEGITPVIMAGDRLHRTPWDQRGVLNLSGELDIREAAAVLEAADYAVMIEGGMSNLRFALGKPAILLTCATLVGLQIWTPPELTTEIRMEVPEGQDSQLFVTTSGFPQALPTELQESLVACVACEPCMWRREHVTKRDPKLPPASTRYCPQGRSLRDVPAGVVIEALKGRPDASS